MNDSDLANSVYAAVYSGIPVYEMICRGIAVMRRHSDSWLNATQILKVAGVEKGRRTKILEREVLTGEHEKIQGGYGKYQGTWVPFTRGVQLCKQYNVYEYIRPILEHDPTASGTRPDRTPTKAEVRKLMKSSQHRSSTVRSSNGPASSTKRGRNDNESTAGKRYKISSSAATSPLHSDIATPYQLNGLAHVNPSSAGYPPRENGGPAIPRATGQPLSQTPRSTTLYSSPAARHRNAELAAMPAASNAWGYSSINEDVSSQTMAESDPSGNAYNARVEHDRMLLMNIFLNEDPNYIPDWLSQIDEAATGSPRSRSNATPNDTPASVNVDLVIDDQGHTAVHWAAALARIHVLDLLLYQNSDARKLNYEGESALVRAVQVTNNYEAQTFPDLLELLHDTIPLTDKNNRTVLHHIALTAGIDGRDKAARYYADCLLSWIVRLAGGYQVENGDIAENGMSDGQNAEPCTADILRQQQSGANAADQSNGEPASIEPSSAAKPVSENGRSIHSLPTPMQSSSPNPKRQPFADLAYESSLSAVQNSSTQASTAKDNFQGSPATLHRQPAAVSLSDGGRQNSAQSDSAQNADFAAFLNLQDVHGNTALSIAARVGDRAIIRMLLNAGASATIQNRVGLCPLDFGVDKITCSDSDPSSLLDAAFGAVSGSLAPQPSFANGSDMLNSPTLSGRTRTQLPQTPLRQGARGVGKNLLSSLIANSHMQSPIRNGVRPRRGEAGAADTLDDDGKGDTIWSPASAEQRMHQSVLSIQRLMSELESDFSGEMRLKQERFDEIKQQLRNTTIELAKARETIHQLHSKTSQLADIKSRVGYLEETLARETSAVREAIGALPPDSKPRLDLEALLDSLLSSTNAGDVLASVDKDMDLPLIPGGSPLKYGCSGEEDLAELEKDPKKLLAAVERLRVVNQVYARRDALLRERVAALRRRADASERERQYRQIIASCCEISEADVDVWIDRLASAVESSGDDKDQGTDLDNDAGSISTPADEPSLGSLAATTAPLAGQRKSARLRS